MKRHLISQMRHEWRNNIWLLVELIIVTAILWFIFSFLCFLYNQHSRYKGYDHTNVYVAYMQIIRQDSPDYIPYDSIHSYMTDRDLLMANIRSNPNVELAGLGQNGTSFNYNYSGQQMSLEKPDTTYWYSGNVRTITPEIARIYRLEGLNGETSDELAAVLERGEVILSNVDPEYADNNTPVEYFRGQQVYHAGDSSRVYKVGATAYGLRRNDYEPLWNGVIYMPADLNRDFMSEVIIRVHPGKGRQFLESITPGERQVGNVYITNLQSVDNMRDHAHLDFNNFIRNTTICALFLMLVIFLGFLGTFWFRTQQRVGEIAVRKVSGATDRNIFTRLIGEGLMLLAIAVIVATPIIYLVVENVEINLFDPSVKLFTQSTCITILILTVLIVAGIAIPARRAMNVNPAFALKDQ